MTATIDRIRHLMDRVLHDGTPIEEARTSAMVAIRLIRDHKIQLVEMSGRSVRSRSEREVVQEAPTEVPAGDYDIELLSAALMPPAPQLVPPSVRILFRVERSYERLRSVEGMTFEDWFTFGFPVAERSVIFARASGFGHIVHRPNALVLTGWADAIEGTKYGVTLGPPPGLRIRRVFEYGLGGIR